MVGVAGRRRSRVGRQCDAASHTIFATWFTYDVDHNPLWYSVTAPQTGANTFSGTLNKTAGPAFNAVPFDPALVTHQSVGTATFTFTNGNAGTFAYDVHDGSNVATQTKPIVRQVFASPGTGVIRRVAGVPFGSGCLPAGAPNRNRTCDLSLRRGPLYPLSYRGDASKTGT